MESDAGTSSKLPLVSIIVPVYNGERYLVECLDSIVAQTYPNIEILVMDNASTDGTPDIIQSYGDKLTHHVNDSNLGQFGNVNKGIEKANGEYLCVYHADDIYKPEIVEREAQYLMANDSAGAVFSMDIFINAKGEIYNKLSIPEELQGGGPFDYNTILNALLTYKNVFLITPTSMVRKSVYIDVGPYNDDLYGVYCDLEMWARIAKKYNLGIVEEHLHYYRHGHGNTMQNHHQSRTEPEMYFRIMQDMLDAGEISLVKKKSIKAYKAHWAEELLMVTINLYIDSNLVACRQCLSRVKLYELVGSPHIQRGRLFVLYILLMVVCRIPRVNYIAELFRRRWHSNKNQAN